MKLIAVIALLALLITPCFAESDSVTTGPYKVTFDLGLPKEVYKVEIKDPKSKESEITYEIDLKNNTGLIRGGSIMLTSYATEQPIPLQAELVWVAEEIMKGMNEDVDFKNSTAREIDGQGGAVASGTMGPYDWYIAMYCPSSTTQVILISTYPWEEGTLQLLNSIHVEKINGTL